MPPYCTFCGYDFQKKMGDWESLVKQHYKVEHPDLFLILSLIDLKKEIKK